MFGLKAPKKLSKGSIVLFALGAAIFGLLQGRMARASWTRAKGAARVSLHARKKERRVYVLDARQGSGACISARAEIIVV